MDRELLIAGDRLTLEVLARRTRTARRPPQLRPAVHAAELALAANDEQLLIERLVDVAVAAISTAARIQAA
jgi:hypothetical protein